MMKVEPRTDAMHAITALTGVILTTLIICSLWRSGKVLGYGARGPGSSPHEGVRIFYAAKRRRRTSDGTCRVVAFTSMTWCKCHGMYQSDKDGSISEFYRPARVCLLMIPGARIQGNIAIAWEDYRKWHMDYRRRLKEDREFGERIFAASPSKNNSYFLARIRSKISRQSSRSKSKRGNGNDSDS